MEAGAGKHRPQLFGSASDCRPRAKLLTKDEVVDRGQRGEAASGLAKEREAAAWPRALLPKHSPPMLLAHFDLLPNSYLFIYRLGVE